ncbi:MAG: hypothetical protein GY742_04400 [Hyphomicrobiales bacterium]|nr:hypothetical protein [Hyphomicrobiales bacterium]
MRDDSTRWAAASGYDRPDININGLQISVIRPWRQTLISGPISKSLELGYQKRAVGWPEIAKGKNYAIRMRRDRIMLINGPAIEDGWHKDKGLAVSDMSDACAVIQLEGVLADSVLKRGTELDIGIPSGSVVRVFHGFETFIYRWQSKDIFRLHIQFGYLESIWLLLQNFSNQASAQPCTNWR